MESPHLYCGVLTAQSDLLLTFCQNLLQERLFEKTPSQFSLFPIYKSLEEKTKQKQKLPRTASLRVQEASTRGKLILVPKSQLGESPLIFHLMLSTQKASNESWQRVSIAKHEDKVSRWKERRGKEPAQESFTETPKELHCPLTAQMVSWPYLTHTTQSHFLP